MRFFKNYSGTKFFVHWKLKLLNFLMDSVLIPVFTIDLLPSQWSPVLNPTYSPPPLLEYLFTLQQSLAQNLSDMWRSTLYIDAAQLLSVTEIIAPKSPFVREQKLHPIWFRACARAIRYRVFLHDDTVTILVFQNNETAAMLVSQTNPLGAELFSYANTFFCSNKFA